ncbi:MAG: hypothetical protein ACXQS2_04355 [Methermicoccaceae archaeon]
MGWTCSYEAGKTIDRIFSKVKGGLVEHGGKRYFMEVVPKSHKDGRIRVRVCRITGNFTCTVEGHFFIMPDGSISKNALQRFPWLEELIS